jgi:serine/threonine protein kinase
MKYKDNYKFRQQYEKGKHEAAFGTITRVCIKNNCTYLSKTQNANADEEFKYKISYKQIFQNEVKILNYLKGLGITIEIIDNWVCSKKSARRGYHETDDTGYIIMQDYFENGKYKGDDLEFQKNRLSGTTEVIYNNIQKLFNKYIELHKKGIIHADVREPNILWRIKNNDIQFVIIDFGLSKMYLMEDLKNIKTREEFMLDAFLDYFKLLNIIKNKYPEFSKGKFIISIYSKSIESELKREYYIKIQITDAKILDILLNSIKEIRKKILEKDINELDERNRLDKIRRRLQILKVKVFTKPLPKIDFPMEREENIQILLENQMDPYALFDFMNEK